MERKMKSELDIVLEKLEIEVIQQLVFHLLIVVVLHLH